MVMALELLGTRNEQTSFFYDFQKNGLLIVLFDQI